MIKYSYLKNFYKNNGFVKINNFLDYNTKTKLLSYINQIENDKQLHKYIHKYELNNNYNKVLCRTEYIIDYHYGMKELLTKGKIPNIVEKINNNKINLYKEKINYKYPNTGSYKSHQDITAYPNTKNHITCMINLCDTNKLNGCLEFSPYNQNKILQHKNGVILNPDKLNWHYCPTNFGDIVLFNSYVPHRSNINYTINPRKSLYITYNNITEGNLRNDYYKNKKINLSDNKISLIDHYDGLIINNTNSNKILDIYKNKGHHYYDKHITNLQHAFLTTQLAKNNNESDEFQLSCFLHDIGHLLLDEHDQNKDFLDSDLKHETIGYKFLSKYFSNNITIPVMYHVLAKRYLCSIDNNYYENLSDSSKKSFIIQGGPLDKNFINILDKNKNFKNALKLRKYEDLSKRQNINITINLDYIHNLINKYIK